MNDKEVDATRQAWRLSKFFGKTFSLDSIKLKKILFYFKFEI